MRRRSSGTRWSNRRLGERRSSSPTGPGGTARQFHGSVRDREDWFVSRRTWCLAGRLLVPLTCAYRPVDEVLRIPKRWLWISLVGGVALWLGGLTVAINFADTRGTLGPVVIGGVVGTVLIPRCRIRGAGDDLQSEGTKGTAMVMAPIAAVVAVVFFAASVWLGVYSSGTGVLLLLAAATPLGTATKEGG